jgi:hypothetical protein
MSEHAEKDMSVEDDDFELITSSRLLGSAPPLRKEGVTLKEWPTTSGKAARFLEWELTAAEYAEFLEEGRVYRDGILKRYDTKDEDFRFLSRTTRDPNNNRIWTSFEAAKLQLGSIGKSSVNMLLAAANRVNSARGAEGNSEATPTD